MKIRTASLSELLILHNQIDELSPIANSDYFAERIGDKIYLALVAEIEGVLVGYKLGYWLTESIFYSWLGGVHPTHRKKGIAKQLLLEQERQVFEAGGTEVRVKSMNQFRSMLLLLIAQEYEITGTEMMQGQDIKILFSKHFNKKERANPLIRESTHEIT
ncbi:GNAT family N-acetyltransferase [Cellvibrio sp. NN19]|uniref:GNAT family N-acetyltransferase n=1 Tax=Cellvibrio chitinivorans TaxID=3102792 RepID=UPI002B40ECE8|nr:GNAT family N-acetyltransferase [Cellvibrio sp. NN19]